MPGGWSLDQAAGSALRFISACDRHERQPQASFSSILLAQEGLPRFHVSVPKAHTGADDRAANCRIATGSYRNSVQSLCRTLPAPGMTARRTCRQFVCSARAPPPQAYLGSARLIEAWSISSLCSTSLPSEIYPCSRLETDKKIDLQYEYSTEYPPCQNPSD